MRSGSTGLLTREGDVAQFAHAIRRLIADRDKRRRMAAAAREFVRSERSLAQAKERLAALLERVPAPKAEAGHG